MARARPDLGALGGALGGALVEALTARLGYKAAALFFAGALWVAASGDELATRYVDVRLAPMLGGDARLAESPPRVRALVSGPARELLKLYAAPPVLRRAVSGRGGADTARVELRPGDVDLPSDVAGVIVRDVRPRAVTFRLRPPAVVRRPTTPGAAPSLPAAASAPGFDSAASRADSSGGADGAQVPNDSRFR